jgi:hypothetical protein
VIVVLLRGNGSDLEVAGNSENIEAGPPNNPPEAIEVMKPVLKTLK